MRSCRRALVVLAVFMAAAALLLSQTQRPAQAFYDEARALTPKNDAVSLRLALERYTQAQALFRTEGKPAMEVEALAARAEIYDRLGDRENALRDYRATKELYRRLGKHSDEALSIALGANEERALKRFDEAIRDYERALVVARAAHDRKAEADMLYGSAPAGSIAAITRRLMPNTNRQSPYIATCTKLTARRRLYASWARCRIA